MPKSAETYLEYTAQLKTIREAIPLELADDNDLRALCCMEMSLWLTERDAKSFQTHEEIPFPDQESLLPLVGDWKRYRPKCDAQSKLIAQQIKITQEHIQQWLSYVRSNKKAFSTEQRIIYQTIRCWMTELHTLLEDEYRYYHKYYLENVSNEKHVKYRERLNSGYRKLSDKELAEISRRLSQAENQENQ